MNPGNPNISLVILAAGASKRFEGYKQFADVGPNKEKIWEYSIYDAYQAGIKKILFITRSDLLENLQRLVFKRFPQGLEVDFAVQSLPTGLREERSKPMGTGHALITALPHLEGEFFLINGDDYYGDSIFKDSLSETINGAVNPPFVGAFPLSKTLSNSGPVNRAIIKGDGVNVESLIEFTGIEKKDQEVSGDCSDWQDQRLSDSDAVSMNFWYLNKDHFKGILNDFNQFLKGLENPTSGEYMLPDVIFRTLEFPIKYKVIGKEWCGLTHPNDLIQAQYFFAEKHNHGSYHQKLWS